MIAIDFGTTNSSVAVFSEGDTAPRLQSVEYTDPESYNRHVLPSVTCECRTNECKSRRQTYGHEALRHGFEVPHDTTLLQEMKLYFDRSTIDPPTLVETKTFTTLREEGGVLNPVSKIQRFMIYDGEVPLQPARFVPGTATLISEIVRRSDTAPSDRDELVIGVPASFGGVGTRRLREAAKLGVFGDSAGYERIFVYPEPLAAARSYMQIATGNILVLDYGGGTLDITVMTIREAGQFNIDKVVYGGFPEGGSAMDQMILKYCLSKADQGTLDWYKTQPLSVRLRLKRNVEKAKISLSGKVSASIEFPNSGLAPMPLTRQEVSFALQPIMTRMVSKVTQIVVRAVGAIENIDFVVMSGGASLSEVVQTAVIAMFRHLPAERFIVPDAHDAASVESCMCAVAKGLALLRKDGIAPISVDDLR
jgi:molecular chaperone DnaK (HSP70)